MKRIESILMTLVLLLCALAAALPAPALADGECGDGLTWSYDMSSNTLTISYSSHGWESGQMNNFDSAADQPWLDYREDAKTVVIAEEVTTIGEFAFCDFSNLTAVTFQGDSQLERICYGAFYGCASLPSISIPANVGLIDELAFKSCSQLAQINYRGTKAQWDQLTKGSGWNTGMGSSVSDGYKVCFVDGSGKVLGKLYQDGFWWEYNSTSGKLTVGHDGANGGAMPDYGKNSNKAPWRTDFEDSITSVVIESGVTDIGKHAFCDCYMITSVTIPETVINIKDSAFYGCESLTSVTIPASVTAFGSSAFCGCNELTSVTFLGAPDRFADHTFFDCEKLKHIDCDKATWLKLGNSNYSLGSTPFESNPRFVDVSVSPAAGGRVTGGGAYANNTQVTLTATAAQGYAFVNWTENGNVVKVNGQPAGAEYTFTPTADVTLKANFLQVSGNCGDNLTWALSDSDNNGSLDTLTISGTGAMYDYSYDNGGTLAPWRDSMGDITTVTVGEGATSVGNSAFYKCSGVANLSLPSTLETIGELAFNGCTGLTAIDIPAKMTFIDTGAFLGCSNLKKVHISDFGAWCGITFNDFIANPLFYKAGLYINNQPVTNLDALPASVTEIKNNAFCGCSTLVSAAIPDGVTAIGNYAFYKCTSLERITLPNSLTAIGLSAFKECKSLENVTFPAGLSVSIIGNYAFENCENLSHIYCTKAQGNAILNKKEDLLPYTPLYDNGCLIAAVLSPADGGTVTGAGLHAKNTQVTLTAAPVSSGYVFVNWTDENGNVVLHANDKPIGAEYTFSVTADRTLTANFLELGSLVIQKSVTVNEEATTGTAVDGTYTFTITGTKGQTVPNATVTILNGQTATTQVNDLVPDTYTVSEVTTNFAENLSGSGSVAVGVTGGNSANPPTAAFTNNLRTPVSAKVTFKVVNGGWNDETLTGDQTVTLTGYTGDALKLAAGDIPEAGGKPSATYKAGSWDTTPSMDTEFENGSETTYTYTYVQQSLISYDVTFKVVNGKWDDDSTADKKVTLSRYENEDLALKLKDGDIPLVGSKPNNGYKAGNWDVTPSTGTAISENKEYTYTYAQKESISQTVTFKVVNGSWDDGTTDDQTVTLTGLEGDTLKLAENQIPAVRTKPADTYKAGAWDVTPSTDTAITEATTYTYTYAAKNQISATVTLKVVHGAWDDGTREDKTVVLSGYEGDELRLTIDDIPQVTKPDEGYEFGSGVWTPEEPSFSFQGVDMGDPITEDTTFTFTYGVKTAVSHTLTISYVYDDQTQAAETYTQAYEEGAEYSVASPVIDGFTPDQATVSGTMGTEDVAVTVTYHTAQVIPVECGHEAEEIPAVPPTCTKRGSTAGEKCKLCGVMLTKPEPVPALGHDYREKRTIVEIGQEGIAGFVCSRCGDTITSYFLMGDVNGDGVVDGRDLLRLARFLAGQDVEIIWQAAEMTGDGEVDGRDLLRLAKYVAGVI